MNLRLLLCGVLCALGVGLSLGWILPAAFGETGAAAAGAGLVVAGCGGLLLLIVNWRRIRRGHPR